MKKMIIFYVLCSLAMPSFANNMLTNGDFESGTSDFTVSSGYSLDAQLTTDGTYAVGNTLPIAWGGHTFPDHTSGSGDVLMVNAATTAGESFWMQDVDVVSGTEYTFSGWVADITGVDAPSIQLYVDGSAEGTTFSPTLQQGTWLSFSFDWTAATTETVTLSLRDLNSVANGDDFAIDDLAMVPEPASVLMLALGGGLVVLYRKLRTTLGHF